MMHLLLVAVPVLMLLGMFCVAVFCMFTDKARKERDGCYYNHPDHDMPLYNRGHCDSYSIGAFYW